MSQIRLLICIVSALVLFLFVTTSANGDNVVFNDEFEEDLELDDEPQLLPPPFRRFSFLPSSERIVTDMLFIEIGVPIDFSYNESSAFSLHGDSLSAPGCPKSIEGRPWVYYGSPPKCFLVGFQGPCSWGKRLFRTENSKYGVCNCDCFALPSTSNRIQRPVTPRPFGRLPSFGSNDISQNLILPRSRSRRGMSTPSEKKMDCGDKQLLVSTRIGGDSSSQSKRNTEVERYQFCQSPSFERLVIYDRLRQECYPVLDQGPCNKNEWLIRSSDKRNGVECERRKCPANYNYGQTDSGGAFSYFNYKTQECITEVFGSLKTSHQAGVLATRAHFCKEGGMKYSHRLKTCVKDVGSKHNFNISVLG